MFFHRLNILLKIYAIVIISSVSMTLHAAQEAIIRFDFKNGTGSTITDTHGKITATLMRGAKITEMGRYHVLDLYDSGYLDLSGDFGAAIAPLETFSISTFVRIDKAVDFSGDGYFLWSFSDVQNNTASSGRNLSFTLKDQKLIVSSAGYENASVIQKGENPVKGKWLHVAYIHNGKKGSLYVNGKQVGQNKTVDNLKTLFSAGNPAYCWIGRAPYTGQRVLPNSFVAEFEVYDRALSTEEIDAMALASSRLDSEYATGMPGDIDRLREMSDRCKDLLSSKDRTLYSPNAIYELEDLREVALTALDNGVVNAKFIDDLMSRMEHCMSVLSDKRVVEIPQTVLSPGEDYGFVHPGGLHTQSDFDRVRNLLKNGDPTVKAAWNVLKSGTYAKSGVKTYPVETVVRGGGSGENYMNACRGAAMAYQNALQWKIDGNEDNARTAVNVLMAWARGNRDVSGDTNMSLAAGLSGYQFAEAAELMRDYTGWPREEFEEFKNYMLRVWYPKSVDFLRRRHDTWRNSANANKGPRPGHYWSNWGLCNALCLMEIGVLCDDVHIYNQGLSFYKYDHVGTFADRSKEKVILNDGLTEYIGNLVPVVLPDERGPLGFLGQMQESGRDQGHALMALGLAADICKVAYSQGEDLFAYMDDRIAAGAEFTAALNYGGVEGKNLPWIDYNYSDCRTDAGKGWQMTGPNTGGLGGSRPYWDRILGYYEGVRGVKMQFSEMAANKMREQRGADAGGGFYGETSGGFDHLGFTTLMDYRPEMADIKRAPVYISGQIEHDGEMLDQTNLGGLKYDFNPGPTKAVSPTGELRLIPILPEGVDDTGLWKWNTGETTREISVKADHSYIYRVTYQADNVALSTCAFTIAVAGDCNPTPMITQISSDKGGVNESDMTVLYGSPVTLKAAASSGWTDSFFWDTNETSQSISINAVTRPHTYSNYFINQGGRLCQTDFNIKVTDCIPVIQVEGDDPIKGNGAEVKFGSDVDLTLEIPMCMEGGSWKWSTGSTERLLQLRNLSKSGIYSVEYRPFRGEPIRADFTIMIPGREIESVDEMYGDSDAEVVRTELYTVDGLRINSSSKGLVIKKSILSDGTVISEKLIIR